MITIDSAQQQSPRRAQLVGTGLVGGSVGLALKANGWHVTGSDLNADAANRALELGAIDQIGSDPLAEITFVAAPVRAINALVNEALATTTGLVTDVGSVKSPMLSLMSNGRYVGGHPMAGSEVEGVDGSRADLFEGATWVLTPIEHTDEQSFAAVRNIVASFGAEVVAVPPAQHDAMVAAVSHVPHLTAATLMRIADEQTDKHQALLRLAAGGFRDMTRIAAGHPDIWPDICFENSAAICAELDRLIDGLAELREIVAGEERDRLVDILKQARAARVALPSRVTRPEELVELRVQIADRKGALAEITTLATNLDVSIADIEIAHSAETQSGALIMLVDATSGHRLRDGLAEIGYQPVLSSLG